jgi:NadR type nicotinamide-nucleotide adenylyltransferase
METIVQTAKRIAIIGPESSGKSTLCVQLADHFQEPCALEFGRAYLEKKALPYEEADLLHIAQGMQDVQDRLLIQSHRMLFCDTDMIMMKVWYEHKYGHCHPYVLDQLATNPYDAYLICYPDLPWIEDGLRENPHIREALFERYLAEVQQLQVPYSIIKGEDRIKMALEFVVRLF